jgi:hypothetical protein
MGATLTESRSTLPGPLPAAEKVQTPSCSISSAAGLSGQRSRYVWTVPPRTRGTIGLLA